MDDLCVETSGVTHTSQKTAEQLVLERERAVEEERARADQLEEQRSVAQLQNELLTEMVAAEQVLRRWPLHFQRRLVWKTASKDSTPAFGADELVEHFLHQRTQISTRFACLRYR